MMSRKFFMCCIAVACAGCNAVGRQESNANVAATAPPKVILIIGDGMDDHQITIARNYLVGYNGRLTLDDMPWRSSVQVQTVAENDPNLPEYVGDSANSATSMSTGIVTSAGRIATTARSDEDATTIMDLASAAGFGTGIVTTASVTDATPASFVAHINQRLCQGPRSMVRRNSSNPRFSTNCSADLKANGGKGSISEQIAASGLDIVLGGGMQQFDQLAEGEVSRTVLDLAAANGFQLIDDARELASVTRDRKVLGLFSPGTMPVKWRGANDAEAQRVQRDAGGRVLLPAPFSCESNPDFEGMPTLAAMSRTALRHLDDGRSFMLMIESASIDKQSHLRRPCGQIGELDQLDETLALVLGYAREHPETLVLVTADHGQAAQLLPKASLLSGYASPGYFARLVTREGAIMGVNYSTNDSPIQEDHTGTQIPLFASTVPAAGMTAMIRQADIFEIMRRHLGLSPM